MYPNIRLLQSINPNVALQIPLVFKQAKLFLFTGVVKLNYKTISIVEILLVL
jgi:hypothetical protein